LERWNLLELDAPGGSRSPVVLHSASEARAVLVTLDPGQSLGDHRVKETAFVAVVGGAARVDAGGESVEAGVGSLFRFEPDETHSIATSEGARVLLFLAPWPGEGHYRGEERELGSV
jgi:quercetin dioxygenase-like cupin family protein